MTGFVVERYWPGVTDSDVRTLDGALRGMREADVTYLGAILIPGDEAVLFCFHATDAGQIERAGTHVGLRCDRVVPAMFVDLALP